MWRRRSHPAEGWPVRLVGVAPLGDPVVLRPMAVSDAREYQWLRRQNAPWLEPWDATSPIDEGGLRSFDDLVKHYDSEAAAGRMLPLLIEVDGRIVGQITLSNIVLGSFRSCSAGYWVSRATAGRGIAPMALAMAGDHVFDVLGLHRLEVNIRPENAASLAVVRKLGFRHEGTRLRMLHIDGDWRDHISFALTTEDLGGRSLVDRLRNSQPSLWRHTETGPA
jgi:ribosomal-protein-alanine N-acetyltransferase